MRLIRTLGALLLAGVVTSQAASIVARHGRLQTAKLSDGRWHVTDSTGAALQLTGMSFFWDQWNSGLYNKGVVDWLVNDWQVSVIRVAMAVDNPSPDYISNPAATLKIITPVIDAAIQDGIYVIIDWHSYDAAYYTPQAISFFSQMAKRYGKLPNVIFEIWNEPNADSSGNVYTWDPATPTASDSALSVMAYAAKVIPAIRQYSSNLVVVGTPTWSSDFNGTYNASSGPVDNPLDPAVYGSVAYAYHFYSCTHTLSGEQTSATSTIPVFVTEWGTTNADGGADGRVCITAGQKDTAANSAKNPTLAPTWFSQWLDPQKISSCNWSVSNTNQGSSILFDTVSSDTGNWTASDLTPSGTWVRANIRAHCAADPSVCPYQATFTTAPVFAVPGEIQAVQYNLADGVGVEATQDPTAPGGQDLTNIDSAKFVQYTIQANAADTLWLQARVADTLGGIIRVLLDGAVVDTIRVYPTGGVQTWSWADGTRLIPITAGAHKLEILFPPTGWDLLRLQRLEVVSKRLVATPVPSQVSLDDFNFTLTGIGLGTIFETGGPSLRHATTRSSAYYEVSAAVADSLSLSIVAANGSPDPASVVVWKKGVLRYAPVDTLVLAPSGWTTWQTLTTSTSLPMDTGTNYLEFTFLGDTGTALVDLGAMSIGTAVTAVQPRTTRNGAILLRREGQTLHVQLPDGGVAAVELLSVDGRIWAQRTLAGSGSIPVPRTHQALWLRVRGQSSAVLAVPPGF